MAKQKNPSVDAVTHVPPWLVAQLKVARASVDFQKRCKAAGVLARYIYQLRSANRARAHERIPLADRTKKLARSARVPLGPVLAWFGLKKMSLSDPDVNLANFGLDLGFKKDEFVELVQIGAAAERGIVVAQAGRGKRRQMEDLHWDAHTLARFRSLRKAVDAAYESAQLEE